MGASAGRGEVGEGVKGGSAGGGKGAKSETEGGAGSAGDVGAASGAWADRAGGTSGALWGAGWGACRTGVDDDALPSGDHLSKGARLGMEAIMRLGKAKPGDKTLVDALVPFVDVLEEKFNASHAIAEAWRAGAETAQKAADATKELLPRLGRARTHGERSKGHPDAGALTLALCVKIVGEDLARLDAQGDREARAAL